MAYLELQDLIDELSEDTLAQLTDDEGTGEINEARVLKAIESAQGTFDFYARSRYTLPVPVTPMVKTINLDLAVYHLYKRMPLAEGVYTVRENAYKAAMKLLQDLSKGNGGLDVPATEETVESPGTADKILTNSKTSKFTDSSLSSF